MPFPTHWGPNGPELQPILSGFNAVFASNVCEQGGLDFLTLFLELFICVLLIQCLLTCPSVGAWHLLFVVDMFEGCWVTADLTWLSRSLSHFVGACPSMIRVGIFQGVLAWTAITKHHRPSGIPVSLRYDFQTWFGKSKPLLSPTSFSGTSGGIKNVLGWN